MTTRMLGAALALFATVVAAQEPATFGPVGHDTLWTIAGKINSQQHLGTTAQLAWALYLKNPQAFEGSPAKSKPSAMLAIPDAATVTAVSNKDAYEKLTGAPAVAALPRAAEAPVATPSAAAPATAPKPARSTAASVEREDLYAAPTIAGIELKPAAGGKQWLGVIGAGFRPGARLELRDMLNGTVFTAQAPAKLSASRIDYEARVGNVESNWLLTVRNADGTQSEAYGFTAGPGIASSVAGDAEAAAEAQAQRRAAAAQAAEKAAADTAGTAQTQAEKDAAEQAAGLKREQERLAPEKAQMDKAAADKAALDRQFEAQMAADRAAYEKQEAAKKKKR